MTPAAAAAYICGELFNSSQLFVSYFVTTTPWYIARRIRHSLAIDSCDEEQWARGESCLNPVCLARLSRTWRQGRAVDRFVLSRDIVLGSPPITAEVPEQQPIEAPSAREPHYQPEKTFKWLCPGEAQRAQEVPERRLSKTSKDSDHDTSSLAASTMRTRTEDIGSNISGDRWHPRHDRHGELIE